MLQALRIAKTEVKNIWSEMRKLLTAYRTAHAIAVPEATHPSSCSTEKTDQRSLQWNWRYNKASDKDAAIKQKRTDYADEKRRARESDLEPGI